MAKTKYNPLQAIQNDPLASLKRATAERVDVEMPAQAPIRSTSAPPAQADDSEVSASEDTPIRSESARLSSAPVNPLSSSLKPSRNTVYLYPEDLTKLRQLSGYASTEHGIRANDSMIVRAALSLMDTDVRFLHALRNAVLSDRRRTMKQTQ